MSRPPKTRNPQSPIAVRRMALGWTQGELAHRAGVSVRTVIYAESGTPKRWPTVATRLIAAVLACSIEDLCGPPTVPRGTCNSLHVGEKR